MEFYVILITMKYKAVCLIDGLEFSSSYKGREKSKLRIHLKNNHQMRYEDYILKYDYEGIRPTCACGCGKNTNFHKGKYHKYYEDHKNYVKLSRDQKEKLRKSVINRNSNIDYRLNRLKINTDELKFFFDDYCSFLIDSESIIKKTGIDFRTIKKYWHELEFIKDKESFRRITKKHQFYWKDKNDKAGGKIQISESKFMEIYFLLKKEKGNITLKELSDRFSLGLTSRSLYKRIIQKFPQKEIDDLLLSGNCSKPEIEFLHVLKFFFGKDLKSQFKLEGKIYDFILNDSLLIEFDGDYWHSLEKNIKNDKIKDQIALKNGYKIFRVKESKAKDIEILKKIKKIAYEN